jgi:hypothetical protein
VGSSPVTAALTISTTKAHFVSGASTSASSMFFLSGGCLLASAFILGAPRRRRRWGFTLGVLVIALLAASIGCSGGSSSSTPKDPGTPAGNYTVTVTATGSTSHQTTVTVVVQ